MRTKRVIDVPATIIALLSRTCCLKCIAMSDREEKLLREKILKKEEELSRLKEELSKLKCSQSVVNNELSNDDIARYSRQIILPSFGVAAQLQLKNGACLIVGMGGLGCPAAQYLVAAGCGTIGLVDYDDVEASNFHRQILHTTSSIGCSKVNSAAKTLSSVNPNCKLQQHNVLLSSDNAMEIIASYDVVLDCTDNVATRYLLNDACVLLHKPLVSGSALQMDGQLTVYNYGEDCPCYRCIFPIPPPPEAVTNCGDGGVLGVVPGVIGVMQALEAIKILVKGFGETLAGRLIIFDATRSQMRNIKLRGRRPDCAVCSDHPTITHLINYTQFCGMSASDKDAGLDLLLPNQRLTVENYCVTREAPHLLIDVRQPAEFEICALPNAQSIPLKQILDDSYEQAISTQLTNESLPIVVVCRRGNDSQLAVQHISQRFPLRRFIYDIKGGLHEWHNRIDNTFPFY